MHGVIILTRHVFPSTVETIDKGILELRIHHFLHHALCRVKLKQKAEHLHLEMFAREEVEGGGGVMQTRYYNVENVATNVRNKFVTLFHGSHR